MNERRANGWGWVGLILSVSLIGAGILYQREGGKLFFWLADAPPNVVPPAADMPPSEPKSVPNRNKDDSGSQAIAGQQPGHGEPPATGDSVDSKTDTKSPSTTNASTRKVGTLKFQIVVNRSRLTSPGPWIYVDRKLRWTCTDPAAAGTQVTEGSLEVNPGTYNIECVATRGSSDLVYGVNGEVETQFVLQTCRHGLQYVGEPLPHVEIRSGEETQVSFHLQASCLNDQSRNDLSIAQPPFPVFGAPTPQMVREDAARADRQIQLFEDDPLVKQLKLLQQKWATPANWPKERVVMLNIADSFGGPREVNAVQVRLIVDWLKWKTWKDFPSGYNYEQASLETAEAMESKRNLDTMFKQVQQQQQGIDELKSIATRLEEAK